MIIDSNRIKFYKYLNTEIELLELKNWIYSNNELENVLPDDQYLDLISYDFSDHKVDMFLRSFVRRNFDWNEYEKWRTIKLLEMIRTDEFDLFRAAYQLNQLYLEQEEEMEKPILSIGLALGYTSYLDRLPMESEYKNWNPESLKVKLEEIERFKTSMLKDIDNELIRLST